MNSNNCDCAAKAWPDPTPDLCQSYYAALAGETKRFIDTCQCIAGQTPTLVNVGKVITGLTKMHFADPHNFGALSEYLTCLVLSMPGYDNPAKPANLLVYLNGTEQPDADTYAYYVVVDIAGAQDTKKVIGNYGGHSPDYSEKRAVNTREVVVRINCFAPSTDIACMMAESIADAMKMFREDILQRVLNISAMEIESITPAKKVSTTAADKRARWTTSIRLELANYLYVTTEGHRLKSFVTTFVPQPAQVKL